MEIEEFELLTLIWPPIQRSFYELCGMPENEVAIAVHFYREYFIENGMIENKAYRIEKKEMIEWIYQKNLQFSDVKV